MYTVHNRMTSSVTSWVDLVFQEEYMKDHMKSKYFAYLFLIKKKINNNFFDWIDPYQIIICPRLHRGPL
jgi:hypothetical protein